MQQINLYLPEFRPQTDWLSAEKVALVLGAFLAILLSIQLVQARQLSGLQKAVLALETEQKAKKLEADALKNAPRPAKDPALEIEIERLRQAIQNRERASTILAQRSMGNDSGFSQHLVALGRQKVEGVSLQNFALQSGGAFVRLEGVSTKPELVPLYISQLQQDQHFASAKFGYLSMQNYGDGVRFLLSGDGPMDPQTLPYVMEHSGGFQ